MTLDEIARKPPLQEGDFVSIGEFLRNESFTALLSLLHKEAMEGGMLAAMDLTTDQGRMHALKQQGIQIGQLAQLERILEIASA